jgi:hypothetical protein
MKENFTVKLNSYPAGSGHMRGAVIDFATIIELTWTN